MAAETRGAHVHPAIDALRGLAALTVVVGHCLRQYPDAPRLVAPLVGPQPPVLLFFMISGFVLGLQIERIRPYTARGYASFLIRRACRLLPAMWISTLAAAAALAAVGQAAGPGLVVRTLAVLPGETGLNPALWSLYVELACGLLMPLLCFGVRRAGTRWGLYGALPLAALMFSPYPLYGLEYLLFFFAGLFVPAWGNRGWVHGRRGAVALAVAVPGYLYAPELLGGFDRDWTQEHWSEWMWAELPACFVVVCCAAYRPPGAITRLLGSSPMRFLGRVSYSLYLLHGTVIAVAVALFAPETLASFPLFAGGVVVSSILLAWGCCASVEEPANRLGRRLAARLSGPEDGTAGPPSRAGSPAVSAPRADRDPFRAGHPCRTSRRHPP